MKKLFLFLAILLCNSYSYGIDIIDMAGRKVYLPENIKRIVPISASLRYIVYLKSMDLVIGIEGLEKRDMMKENPATGKTYWLAIKDRIKNIPSIGEGGPGKLPDLEKLVMLNPDLIITYEKDNAELIQNRTNIPVVVINYVGTKGFKLKDITDTLDFLGKILKREQRARELNQYILTCIHDLSKRTKDVTPISIYIGGISARGIHGITSSEAKYPPLRWINVKNVVDETKLSGHIFIDREKLLYWNPEYLFIDAAGLPLVKDEYLKYRPFFKKLKAITKDKVYTLFPYNFYRANFENLLINAYFIGKTVYPEKFTDIDPEQKAREICKNFLGIDVYDQLKKNYPGFKHVKF